jgi:hypothetical protein
VGALKAMIPADEVEGPDGKVYTFPSGTPKAEIVAKMSAIYGVSSCEPSCGGDTFTFPGGINAAQKLDHYQDFLD